MAVKKKTPAAKSPAKKKAPAKKAAAVKTAVAKANERDLTAERSARAKEAAKVWTKKQDARRELFEDAFAHLTSAGVEPGDLVRLFSLKRKSDPITKSEHWNVIDKARKYDKAKYEGKKDPYRNPTKSDILAIQLLEFLHKNGFDISGLVFEESGKLKSIPKR